MTRPTPPCVTVTIDRLVLRGFAAAQRDAIAAGLVAELQKQLGNPANTGQFGDSRSLASVRAAPMAFASPTTPGQIGARGARQLARSIRS